MAFSSSGRYTRGRTRLLQNKEENMPCRGVRGATTADANSGEAILKATRELLALMIRQNGIQKEDVASAMFTTTHDLDAEFPALAARQLGLARRGVDVSNELDVPGSLRRCIRVLVHWNTDKRADETHPRLHQGRPPAAARLQAAAGGLGRVGAVDRRPPRRRRKPIRK